MGRKKLEQKPVGFSTYLPQDIADRIKSEAQSADRSVAAMLRQLITIGLQNLHG